MTKKEVGEAVKLTLPVSERDHIQGSESAAVTLVEYGDYECPYCAQAYMIIKEVQERLGSKLRFVFRNFPVTNLRPNSYQVALAAETAAAQNMFWEMYDYLFKHGQRNTDESLRVGSWLRPRNGKVQSRVSWENLQHSSGRRYRKR